MADVSLRDYVDARLKCIEDRQDSDAANFREYADAKREALHIQSVEYARRLDDIDRDLKTVVSRLIYTIVSLVALATLLYAMKP